jgi:hypothetical protein
LQKEKEKKDRGEDGKRDMQGVRMKKIENRIDKLYDVDMKESRAKIDEMRETFENYANETSMEVGFIRQNLDNLLNIRR